MPLAEARKQTRFGMDPQTGKLALGSVQIPMPRSRIGRIVIGLALIVCGTLGFLPILGFWMLPLGFLVLSQDLPFVRRQRRKLACWWARRRRARNGR
ncbi:hypothetical protein KX729_01925 [Rhizobium sp. XQZ8]|nr:hypothetical protein [Rhizobium populisoli]